jgi:hypothetical protein
MCVESNLNKRLFAFKMMPDNAVDRMTPYISHILLTRARRDTKVMDWDEDTRRVY